MKKIIFVFLFTCFYAFPLTAQLKIIGGNEYRLQEKKSSVLKDIEGSPYLDEDFLYGSFHFKNKKSINGFLRYNVAFEELEIKLEEGSEEIFVVDNQNQVNFTIGLKEFFWDKLYFNGDQVFGYFIELFKGEKYRLLSKPIVLTTEAVEAKNGFEINKPAKIWVETDYYLLENDGRIQKLILKNRSLKKNMKDEIAKRYLSKHDIKDSQDLVNFISYLDSNP